MTPADVMRDYLAAMKRGDRETGFSYYADDLVAHVPGRSRFAGTLEGKDAFVGYIAAVVDHVEDAELEIVDILEGEEHVALFVHERFRGPDGELDIRRANIYRVRDDKITEIWIFEANQYEVDAYLAATTDRG